MLTKPKSSVREQVHFELKKNVRRLVCLKRTHEMHFQLFVWFSLNNYWLIFEVDVSGGGII